MSKLSDNVRRINNFFDTAAIYVCKSSFPGENHAENWNRFLSIDKPGEKEYIDELANKKAGDLTTPEIKALVDYKKRHQLADLFLKYDREECTVEEHRLVYNFMEENNIKDIIYDLLSDEEKKNAKESLERLRELPTDKKYEIIHYLTPMYDKLSLLDCYLVREFYEMATYEANMELNERIRIEQIQRERSLIRHLHEDGYL